MNEPSILFKTNPGYVMIVIGVLGSIFFDFWFFSMTTAKGMPSGVDQSAGKIIFIIFECIFLLFCLGCFLMALSFRIFTLTQNQLIIKRPLLFYNRTIYLADIDRIKEVDAPIRVENNTIFPSDRDIIYNGRRVTLELKSGKKIKISSLETGSYKTFRHQLIMQVGKVKTGHK
ncbi:MAG TPA: hypothetical protein VGI43_01785 [Mucilaginibacter sp.]|jgi:hypothetical protein